MSDEEFILKELLARRKASENYADFCRYVLMVEPARHHRLICAALERVLSGESKRLLVTAPPGSAKSTYTTLGFPAYYLGKRPKDLAISASHTFPLAEDFGRKVRTIVFSDEYKRVFPDIKIPSDNRAAAKWGINHGGGYTAVGAGTGISGRRANLAIVDDPYPSRKEANSPAYRKEISNWFWADLQTRMVPGAPIILIQTRWHPEDLAGEILQRQEAGEDMGYEWEHLNFQAIYEGPEPDPLGRSAEVPEALWPEWEPLEELLRKKASFKNPLDWMALFQQRPTFPEGNIVKANWLKYYSRIPREDILYTFQTWDTAGGSTLASAFTVCLTIAVTVRREYYILHMFRGRPGFPEQMRLVPDLYREYNVTHAYIENKQTGQSLLQSLRGKGMNLIGSEPRGRGDKEVRFESVTPVIESGRLFLPVAAPWRGDFETEIKAFPLGTADIVDSLSQGLHEEEGRIQHRRRRGMAGTVAG